MTDPHQRLPGYCRNCSCARVEDVPRPPTVYAKREHPCGCVDRACFHCRKEWRDTSGCRNPGTAEAFQLLQE